MDPDNYSENCDFDKFFVCLANAQLNGAHPAVLKMYQTLYAETLETLNRELIELYGEREDGWYEYYSAFATAEGFRFAECQWCMDVFLYQPHTMGCIYCDFCRESWDPFSERPFWLDVNEEPRDPITWEICIDD